jgi:lipopolysaccharide export system ATP-binding protein
VLLNGEKITTLPLYRRARLGLGYLSQEASIFRKMTVEENILAILEMQPVASSDGRRLSSAERQRRADALLGELNLLHLSKSIAATLSGGERRRLEITRALVTNPSFLLLDEPFAGVDPIVVIEIQKVLFQLKAKGIGVFITDHNVDETLAVCDRAYIIHAGEILLSGTPSEIAESPVAKERYLGEQFKL